VPGELRVVRDEVARLGLAQGAQALEVVDLVLEVGRDGDERVELRDLLCEAAAGREGESQPMRSGRARADDRGKGRTCRPRP